MRTAVWFLVLGAAVFLPDSASACSCVGSSACSRYNRSDAVFLGTIAAVHREGSLQVATLDVTRTWKGRVDKRVTVSNESGTSCSFHFVVGQRFLVYGSGEGRQFQTFMCQGGGPLRPEDPDPDLPPRAGRVVGEVAQFDVAPARGSRKLTPHADTRVWLATDANVFETRTDASGRFVLDGIPPGRHVVRADVGPALEAEARVELESTLDCGAVFVMPRPLGRLAGVLHADGPTAVAGTDVYAVPVDHDWTKGDLSDSRSVAADDGGRFELSGLRPGRYFLTVNVVEAPRVRQPFAPAYYPGVDRREDAVLVDVGEGQAPPSLRFALRALPLTTIKADILCRDGSLPRSGLVYARRADSDNYHAESTDTAVDGRFAVTVMDGLPYDVHGEVLVPARDAAGRIEGFTGLRTPAVRVEAGSTAVVRLVAPLTRCYETTIDGSRPFGRW